MKQENLEGFHSTGGRYCNRSGFIYFIRDRGNSGAIKIGFTEDLSQKRIMGIFQAVPNELMWIGCYPAKASEERALHKTFADSNMKGEWFHPTESVMTFILERFPEYTLSASVY